MLNSNEDLENAVNEDNYERVKALLSRGVNANHRLKRNNETLLHTTCSVEITRELLLHGAEVNCLNKYKQTPLHCATRTGKKFELIRELLKNGVDVNARSRVGNTALFYAVKYKQLRVIKLLFQYGASIKLTTRTHCAALHDKYPFPHNGAGDVDTTKVVVKLAQLNNHINPDELENYHPDIIRDMSTFHLLLSFYQDRIRDISFFCLIGRFSENDMTVYRYSLRCLVEIFILQCDNIIDDLSIYAFLKKRNFYITPAQAQNKLNKQELLIRYPIYHDIILEKLESCIRRSKLLQELRGLEFYVRSTATLSNQDIEEKKIILNFDSTCTLIKYMDAILCNDDLENLITAFYKGTRPLDFSDNGDLIQPNTMLDDDCANVSS